MVWATGRDQLGAENTQHVVCQSADYGLDRQLHIYCEVLKGKGRLFFFYTIGPLCSHPATSSVTSGGLCQYNVTLGWLAVHSVLEFILESSLVTIHFLTKISLGLKEIKLLANSTAQLIICFEII